MNREEFYKEIGNIDDDLIMAASQVRVRKGRKKVLYRAAGLAACLCLICGGLLFGLAKDHIYINELSVPVSFKVINPAGENTQAVTQTYEEMLAYYGIKQMPEAFGEDLAKREQSCFVIYQDQKGNVIYDTNILYYSSAGGEEKLTVTLAKAEKLSGESYEKKRWSEMGGNRVLIAVSPPDEGGVYWARFTFGEVSVQLVSEGVGKDRFIGIIEEIMMLL